MVRSLCDHWEMKHLLVLACVLVGCASTSAQARRPAATNSAPVQLAYYSDAARKYFMATVPGFQAGTQATEKVLMVKTLDSQNGRFREVACINDGKQPAYVSPVYMKVDGNKISAISDTPDFSNPNKLTGTGTLSGNAWDWNYLTFSMVYQTCPSPQCKSQVNDANFVVRGQGRDGTPFEQLIGRKQLFLGNGSLFELYDLEMDKITLDQGLAKFSEMGCPANQKGALFNPSW